MLHLSAMEALDKLNYNIANYNLRRLLSCGVIKQAKLIFIINNHNQNTNIEYILHV